MTNENTQNPQPMDMHRADIVAALKKKGTSVRALSRTSGMSDGNLYNSLKTRCPKGDQIIADALGLSRADIWPSRYLEG